ILHQTELDVANILSVCLHLSLQLAETLLDKLGLDALGIVIVAHDAEVRGFLTEWTGTVRIPGDHASNVSLPEIREAGCISERKNANIGVSLRWRCPVQFDKVVHVDPAVIVVGDGEL